MHSSGFILLFIWLASCNLLFAQDWINGIKATGSDQSYSMYDQSAMAVDTKGNMVVAGNFKNSLSWGDFTVTMGGDGNPDIFIARIGSDGEPQWLKSFDAGGYYAGQDMDVSIDDDGNIYLTGGIDGVMYVSKYDSTGKLIWFNNLGSYGYGSSVTTDIYDNVYVGGGSGWTFVMAEVSFDGKTAWKKDLWFNSSAACQLTSIDVDVQGNIFFAGSFGITLALGQLTLVHGSGYGQKAFWGMMTSGGKFVWVKSGEGTANENLNLALSADGHLFLAGGFFGSSITFGDKVVSGGNCCNGTAPFIMKGDLNGNVLWARKGNDTYNGSYPWDIQLDHAGSLYLTGNFFDCYGSGCTEEDFYFEKYDADGNSLWRKEFRSNSTEYSKAVDIDNGGQVYLMGMNVSSTFIDPFDGSGVRTYGVGIYDTQEDTYRKTPRPIGDRVYSVCDNQTDPLNLTVDGVNLNWYSDRQLVHVVGSGEELQVSSGHRDTVYVTQNVGSIFSWPKPVIVYVPNFPEDELFVKSDKISAFNDNAYTYQWLYQGDSIDNATTYFVNVDSTTHYDRFSVDISDGFCMTTFSNISVVSGLDKESVDLSVYPNPVRTTLTIQGTGPFQVVQVIDFLGRSIDVKAMDSGPDQVVINLADEPPGVYIVELQAKRGRKVVKIVKQ